MDIMGIDPGLKGSAALLRRDINRHGRLASTFLDMVDLEIEPDGEKRNQIDAGFLCDLLERWNPDVVVLENVRPAVHGNKFGGGGEEKSSMSPSDAFRFGLCCGMIRGIVKAYQLQLVMVDPRKWTHSFGLKGGDKKPHIACIKELAPSSRRFITLVKHDGRADAGLIALWYSNRTGMV